MKLDERKPVEGNVLTPKGWKFVRTKEESRGER